jgi:hypothetical protein
VKGISIMSKYITGQEILERWGIIEAELLAYLKNGLEVYRKTGDIFDCPDKYNLKKRLENINRGIAKIVDPDFPENLSHWDKKRLLYYEGPPESVLHRLKSERPKIKKKFEALENKKKDKNCCSWFYLELPDSEEEVEKLIDKVVNSYFLKVDVLKKLGPAKKGAGKLFANTQTGKKLRPVQRHKIECRRIAAELWNKDPSITIEDMVRKDEINSVSAPKIYGKKTLRNWIKDLCPNRTPGRRPKKVKN